MINPSWQTKLAEPRPCPYLEGREFTQEYFFARNLSPELWGDLLDAGWRRFGFFFFRPRCKNCQACIPLRLKTRDLEISKSMRKVWNRNQDVEFKPVELLPSEELFEVYREHHRDRFGESSDYGDFQETFFSSGAPGLLSTYRINGVLAAAGFLDVTDRGLSSVYFVYGSKFSSRSLGTYSVLKEAEFTRDLGLASYYLGYWVQGNARMEYKHRFRPRELLDWESGLWGEDKAE